MKKTELQHIIKECVRTLITENFLTENAKDPSKEEMMEFLRQQFGNEDPDSMEVAIYWFANEYHGGQWSNLYSVLSTSHFRPGPISRGPEPGSAEADMFHALEAEYGGKEHQHDIDSQLQQEDGGAGAAGVSVGNTTAAVQGYQTPRAFKRKKVQEIEISDPSTGEVAPGPRDRFEMKPGGDDRKRDRELLKWAIERLQREPTSAQGDNNRNALLGVIKMLKKDLGL